MSNPVNALSLNPLPLTPLPLQSVADATGDFLKAVADPRRIEAKVTSHDGMPLLCAVEAVLDHTLPKTTKQELVWLSRAPSPGMHVLALKAFGAEGAVLAETILEFG